MFKSRIPEIARRLRTEVPPEAQRLAAREIIPAARLRIHNVSGDLARSIHAEYADEAGRHLVWIVADAHAPPPRERASRGATQGAPYGRIVEFGSHHASAHPFLVPALEQNRRIIEAGVNALIREACR